MKTTLSYLLYAFMFIAASCAKDSGNKNAEPYIASPEKLINMTGSDWNSVEPQVKDKKDYWYTEFTQDQYLAIKAAVSLKAKEETFADINYYMLLNVQRGTDKTSAVSVSTIDSLKKISKDEAYKLMLFYYNNGLKPITDTSYTSGNYMMADGIQKNTTVNEIVAKLQSGFETPLLSINYKTSRGDFSILLTKQNENEPYQFSFNGFN